VALQLTYHQLHVDPLACDIPHAQRLAYGHARVLLAVRYREWHRNLLRVVQRRDALKERAHIRVRLIAVFAPPLVPPPVRRVLEEGRPMRNAKIGQSARELGRKMYERSLRCTFLSLSKATLRGRQNKSYIDHVAAIC
jgi:hypothetical protein